MKIFITNGKYGADMARASFSIRADAKRETIIKRVNQIKEEKNITDPVKVIKKRTLHKIAKWFTHIEEFYTEDGYVEPAA